MPKPTPEDEARIEKMLSDGSAAAESMFDHDDFRAIIVGQTFVETVIERLWKRQLLIPDTFNQTGFERHVQLAVAFGEVPQYLKECLLKIASMRNVLAHHLGGHVKEEAVRELRAAVDRVTEPFMVDDPGTGSTSTLAEAVDMICEHATRRNSFGAAAISADGLFVRALMLLLHVFLLGRYKSPQVVHPRARQQVLDEVLKVIDDTTVEHERSNLIASVK